MLNLIKIKTKLRIELKKVYTTSNINNLQFQVTIISYGVATKKQYRFCQYLMFLVFIFVVTSITN